MRDRETRPHLIASATFAILVAVTVVIVAGYYESPLLLIFQLLLIAGPTYVAFLPLPKVGQRKVIYWLVIAALLIAGWGYVVYVDTRPYQGGGASFALLFGWFTCVVGTVLAATIHVLHRRFTD